MAKKTLVSSLIVGNDASRYLHEVLNHLQMFVDGLVIIDDGSTDGTETLCLNQPKLLAFHKRKTPGYGKNPIAVRRELWSMLESLNPEWVVALEADELFDDEITRALPEMIRQERYDAVRFPVYHLWGDRHHIRVDQGFNPQHNYELLLYRFKNNYHYHWPRPGTLTDRCPTEVYSFPALFSHIRVFHLGWSSPKAIRENPMPDYPLHPSHRAPPGINTPLKSLTPTLIPWTFNH